MGETLNRKYPIPERTETPDVQLDLRQALDAIDADMDAQIDRLVVLETPAPVYRAATRGSNQTIASGSATDRTLIQFNSDVENLGGITLANQTTFTVPKAGLYRLSLVAGWGPDANGSRGIGVLANGTAWWLDSVGAQTGTVVGGAHIQSGSVDVRLPKDATVQFFAGQNSGANRLLTATQLLASITLVSAVAP